MIIVIRLSLLAYERSHIWGPSVSGVVLRDLRRSPCPFVGAPRQSPLTTSKPYNMLFPSACSKAKKKKPMRILIETAARKRFATPSNVTISAHTKLRAHLAENLVSYLRQMCHFTISLTVSEQFSNIQAFWLVIGSYCREKLKTALHCSIQMISYPLFILDQFWLHALYGAAVFDLLQTGRF